jgi:hypothetical protein
MAVGAADFALGELSQDGWPCVAPRRQKAHREFLGGAIHVVEFQHHRISLAAVNTWVGEEVFPEPALPFQPSNLLKRTVALNVVGPIQPVMGTPIGREALAAQGVPTV